MEKKNEVLNRLFVELDCLFNSTKTIDAFYHHYANAKSIFNDELKQIEEKPTVANQAQIELVFDCANPINKETRELMSAIYKDEKNINIDRLHWSDVVCRWATDFERMNPEIGKIARMGKRLYSAMRIFRNWEGQSAVQFQIYKMWKNGTATIPELDRFTNMNNRKNIVKLNAIILKAYNVKNKKEMKVADFINDLFNAWKL